MVRTPFHSVSNFAPGNRDFPQLYQWFPWDKFVWVDHDRFLKSCEMAAREGGKTVIIVLNYKGYEGIIDYPEPNMSYWGYVRGLPGEPKFCGATPQEVIEDFRICVDYHTARLEKEKRAKRRK